MISFFYAYFFKFLSEKNYARLNVKEINGCVSVF